MFANPTKASLESVKEQFDKWRSQQLPNTKKRIPAYLWKKAVALTEHHKVSQVAYHLALCGGSLKKNILKYRLKVAPNKPVQENDFVKVKLSETLALQPQQSMPVIEFEKADGTKMKLSVTSAEIASIIRSFLSAPLCSS